MRKYSIILFLLLLCPVLSSQTILNIKGQTYNSTETGTWNGVQIDKTVPTVFSFIDNSITAVNTGGYMLLAGDEVATTTNNNLDGEIITGNKLTWNGTAENGLHGLFVGYNKNVSVKYNYLDNVPYGIIFKSGNSATGNMTFTSGGFAYNIVRNSSIAIRIKGINGICINNNTFFDNKHTSVPATIYITSNPDNGASPSIGTKIKNNIFYSAKQITNIYLEAGCESGFECDYNVYYCESGAPLFSYQGAQKTFLQWQALGYDLHSKVINPAFTDIKTLIPSARLDYGTDLGSVWSDGLATNAVWGSADLAKTKQNGIWQAGARIYGVAGTDPVYVSSAIENNNPSLLVLTYSLVLANIIPAVKTFSVKVNSQDRSINSVTVSGANVILSLSGDAFYGDVVAVSYAKPAENPLQTASGNQASSMDSQPVINNCANASPTVIISSPVDGSNFNMPPENINITVNTSDPDGSITHMTFYNDAVMIGEADSEPFSFSWINVSAGTYYLTAVATDNYGASAVSDPILVNISKSYDPDSELINLYPALNDGNFTVDVLKPLENERNIVSVINMAGKKMFEDYLLKEEGSKQFSLTSLNPGTYIFMVVGKDIQITRKFIKY